jgi:hypothetical protein
LQAASSGVLSKTGGALPTEDKELEPDNRRETNTTE